MTATYGKETMNVIDRAVDRGTELLNEFSPHWFKIIDLATFNIELCSDCLIGQLLPDYGFADGFDVLIGASSDVVAGTTEPSTFGFDTGEDVEYEDLGEAWVERIEELRDSSAADAATYTAP